MLLILVDDATTPFWLDEPAATWDGFRLEELAGGPPDRWSRPISDYFNSEIASICERINGPYCVLTDGGFGLYEPSGGIRLLNKQVSDRSERFIRGCVHSTSPGEESQLHDRDRCITHRSEARTRGVAAAVEYLRSGQRPPRFDSARTSRLRDLIHILHNVPLFPDAGTIEGYLRSGSALDQRQIRIRNEIAAEYFAPDGHAAPALIGTIRGHLARAGLDDTTAGFNPAPILAAAAGYPFGGADGLAELHRALRTADDALQSLIAKLRAAEPPA